MHGYPSTSGAVFVYHFCKLQLDLDICNILVPEKVNSSLESTIFNSKSCAGKEGKRIQAVWCGAKMQVELCGPVYENHTLCNHGAFVCFLFASGSLQTGCSLWYLSQEIYFGRWGKGWWMCMKLGTCKDYNIPDQMCPRPLHSSTAGGVPYTVHVVHS